MKNNWLVYVSGFWVLTFLSSYLRIFDAPLSLVLLAIVNAVYLVVIIFVPYKFWRNRQSLHEYPKGLYLKAFVGLAVLSIIIGYVISMPEEIFKTNGILLFAIVKAVASFATLMYLVIYFYFCFSKKLSKNKQSYDQKSLGFKLLFWPITLPFLSEEIL